MLGQVADIVGPTASHGLCGWLSIPCLSPAVEVDTLSGGFNSRNLRDISMDPFLEAAIEEAKQSLAEGGIPIGSVLAIGGAIVGRGHNRRVQRGSAILHAEMDCLENCGRLTSRDYRRSVLYSTLSPCDMCSGAAILYQIPKVVIGENQTFRGPEEYLRERGVELEIVNDPECIRLMRDFIATKPQLWNEDIGR